MIDSLSVQNMSKRIRPSQQHPCYRGYRKSRRWAIRRICPFPIAPIGAKGIDISCENLIQASIYFSVRKCIEHTWTNHNDQFLYPSNKWKKDIEFQNDCLAYTLFHGKNTIQSQFGANHWIPFLESEVNARDKFDSHFMMSFISGKLIQNKYVNLFEPGSDEGFIKREFSAEAQAVFAAGKKLWIYYHKQPKCNVNASLYDIREHFQGRNAVEKHCLPPSYELLQRVAVENVLKQGFQCNRV